MVSSMVLPLVDRRDCDLPLAFSRVAVVLVGGGGGELVVVVVLRCSNNGWENTRHSS